MSGFSAIPHNEQPDPVFGEWIQISSSVLLAARYSSPKQLLQLAFRSGRYYQYEYLPSPIFDELLTAASKGTYFNQHIRDHFPFTEIIPT